MHKKNNDNLINEHQWRDDCFAYCRISGEGPGRSAVFVDMNAAFEEAFIIDGNKPGIILCSRVPAIGDLEFNLGGLIAECGGGERITDEKYSEMSERWFELTIYCLKAGHFALTISDISGRRRIEEAFNQSHNFFKTILNVLNAGISIVDESGMIVYTNEIWRRQQNLFFGKDLCPGANYFEYLSFPYLAEEPQINLLLNGINGVLTGGQDGFLDEVFEKNSGAWYRVSVNRYNLKGSFQAVIIFEDISELKKTTIRLKELNDMRDKLFSIIAHDLRGPVGNIQSMLEIICDANNPFGPDDLREALYDLLGSSGNVSALLENLLDWSLSVRDDVRAHPEKVDVKSLIIETAGLLKGMAAAKDIRIKFDPEPGLYICAEGRMIKTVIRNIISNAIKYSRPGGEITVMAAPINSMLVEVRVTDNGIGMSPKTLEGLFKLSKNASSPGTAGERGTGLGLVICREFIERNNGRIWAESESGKGSTVFLEVLAYI